MAVIMEWLRRVNSILFGKSLKFSPSTKFGARLYRE